MSYRSPSLCVRCGAETPDGVGACHSCMTSLERALQAVPGMVETAQVTIARQDSSGGGVGGSLRPGAKLPLSLGVSLAVDALHKVLVHWWGEASPSAEGPAPTTPAAAAAALHRRLPVVRRLPAAGTCVYEVVGAVTHLTRCVDLPPDIIRVGECPRCGGDIVAARGSSRGECRGCGTRGYDAQHYRRTAVEAAWNQTAPLSKVCTALREAGFPVNQNTARSWVKRGHLTPHSHSPEGVALFNVSEVYRVSQEMSTP